MLIAITRAVSRSILQCELTHLARTPIHLERAREQHRVYEEALRSLGVQVVELPEEPDLPDAVFVEDAAIVLDECALITMPGAESRRAETVSIATALAPYRRLQYLRLPATLDGGDVLVAGRTIYVGISSRSNHAANHQMHDLLGPLGYTLTPVSVSGCLHLKSAMTLLDEDTLLLNPAWVERDLFPQFKIVEIDPAEPYAANALRVADRLIHQPAYPRTLERLEKAGYSPLLVDASELGKAEGALTCCSLIFTFFKD